MKIVSHISTLFLLAFLAGCANPLNRATSNRYSHTCLEAEQAGNMELAAETCKRAYINVELGNLSPEEKSEKLYNLGRVLRKAGHLNDSKEVLIRSLVEEEKITGKNSQKSGRRMTELSAIYYQLNQFEGGTPYLDAVIPISGQYTEAEKRFIAALLYFYGNKLQATQKDKADIYHAKMTELGYSSEDFKNWR